MVRERRVPPTMELLLSGGGGVRTEVGGAMSVKREMDLRGPFIKIVSFLISYISKLTL